MSKLSGWLVLLLVSVTSGYSTVASASLEYSVDPNKWILISVPGDPGSQGTVENLFGDDLPMDDYKYTWTLFGREISPLTGLYAYVNLTPQSVLVPGKSYWFLQKTTTAITLTLPSPLNSPETRKVRGCSSIVGCTTVDLNYIAGTSITWNMIGFPRNTDLDMSSLRVVSDSGACRTGCTLSEADKADILYSVFYRSTGKGAAYELLTENSTIKPWDGLWVALFYGAEGIGARLEMPDVMPPSQIPDLSKYKLAFNDEFDGPVLDSNKWNTGFLWGPYIIINKEEQVYIDTLGMHAEHSYDPFSFTPEGTLKITASATSEVGAPPAMPAADDPVWKLHQEYRAPKVNETPFVLDDMNYVSGLLNTYEAFKFTHGYVETRAKVPAGQGLWPAFWMLTAHYLEDVPEIDVMEFLGHNVNGVYHTYHYFDIQDGWKAKRTPSFETIGPDFSRDFHVYGMSWDPKQIIWYVDGMEVRRVDQSEYKIANQAMYLLLNLAVGGTWPKAPDASTVFPAVFEIDYIRAYSREMSVPLDLDEYEIVFADEFDGSTLDAAKWNTRFVWGPFLTINKEEQYYVDALGIDANTGYSPFTVANGNLTIRGAIAGTETPVNTATPAYPINDPYWADKPAYYFQADYTQKEFTSGILTTWDSFKFSNGYAEIRAQIPVGNGLWPAFWLLNRYYIGAQPEIDIMEILGENPGEVIHSYHRRNNHGVQLQNSYRTTGGTAEQGFGDGFHTFGAQWTEDSISWYVDGELKHTFTDPTVSYHIMYVLLNLAVGGAFNELPVDREKLPADYVIDYVRVYQQKPVP